MAFNKVFVDYKDDKERVKLYPNVRKACLDFDIPPSLIKRKYNEMYTAGTPDISFNVAAQDLINRKSRGKNLFDIS